MSTFKEAQPRKVPVDNNVFSKPKAEPRTPPGTFPARGEPSLRDNENAQTPIRALPDASDFQYRTAALQAAATIQSNPQFGMHGPSFWNNVEHFEAYLRDGAKPV